MKTKAEYEKYKKSVEGFFKGEGISSLSQIQDKDGYCEPHFSGIPCECCNSPLGGDRYDWVDMPPSFLHLVKDLVQLFLYVVVIFMLTYVGRYPPSPERGEQRIVEIAHVCYLVFMSGVYRGSLQYIDGYE